MRHLSLSLLLSLSVLLTLHAQHEVLRSKTYRSFEVRHVTDDTAANGETDFRGPTATMSTEDRLAYLDYYQREARRFFDDPELAHEVVSDAEAGEAAAAIKPQPLPEVRRRIPLEDWLHYGYRKNKDVRAMVDIATAETYPFLKVRNGKLRWTGRGSRSWEFPGQAWRSALYFDIQPGEGTTEIVVGEYDKIRATTLRITPDGRLSFTTADDSTVVLDRPLATDRPHRIQLEYDMQATVRRQDLLRYNLYVDGELIADYIPIERTVTEGVNYAAFFTSMGKVNTLTVTAGPGTTLDNLWGVGYALTGREAYPYLPETFLDEDYDRNPGINDWATADYAHDSLWATGTLPLSHGGEKHTQEDLYLRKKVYVGEVEKAFWNVETLDPGGELYVNGQLVANTNKRHQLRVDISDFLTPNDSNLLAVKVNHFYITEEVGEIMPHSSLDMNVGWFAGRMSLDLVERAHLTDVFAYTNSLADINPRGTRARAQINIRPALQNDGFVSFDGTLDIEMSPWFPEEGPVVARKSYPVVGRVNDTLQLTLDLPEAELWTPERPFLYKIRAILRDQDGREVDDYVITTGVRTVDQQGGQFNLNGRVSMLNGAQTFGFRSPIETMLRDQRNAPAYWVAKEIMQIKRMNGNLLRTHVHAWEFPARGTNDPRFAEYADQLGLMLLWCPTSWIRTGRGWRDIDFESYPYNMRQVRNHPSIVMWEAANHTQSFKGNPPSESNRYVEAVYEMMRPVDPSRLISVNSYIAHLHYGNDAGTITYQGEPMTPTYAWTAPGVTRGNQDSPTGYRKNWSQLRNWPDAYRQDLLDSKERAYFNFEHQESMAQPNWNLCRGRPWYRLHSYEHEYDEVTIGRRLNFDEWPESQAWQGFSAWEAIKKMRWLGYDGFSWCCLHGGPNSVTYKKPLIDFLGHAKIAWHTNKMAFQPSVAGSYDVDMVYGPEDEITPVVIHWGADAGAELTVNVMDAGGTTVDTKTYSGLVLEAGRNETVLEGWRPDFGGEGFYTIEYTLELDDSVARR